MLNNQCSVINVQLYSFCRCSVKERQIPKSKTGAPFIFNLIYRMNIEH